jgi:tight adherence protein C
MDGAHHPGGGVMVSAALGLTWAALIVVAGVLRRPLPHARWHALHDVPDAGGAGRRRRRPTLVLSIALLGSVLALAGGPLVALAGAIAAWCVPRWRRLRRARHARAALDDGLPEVVALLSLTIGAGLSPPEALRLVAERAREPWRSAVLGAVAHHASGSRFADALPLLPRATSEADGLVRALVTHERYGTPVLPVLERVGAEARAARRRRSQQAARRVPVLLLFPLVVCILPAFALLTVVPLLVGSSTGLRL